MNLAIKYRPLSLDDIAGQEHLLGAEGVLRKLLDANAMSHAFFYGPAGCGKTSLARVIAKIMKSPFYDLNATTLKIEELRTIFKNHTNSLQKPLVFIDEVHRLSKTQQEVLLPFMERYDGIVLGASTENPYYTLTSAVRSRSYLFELRYINEEQMFVLLEKVTQKENIQITDEAKQYAVHSSSGDARAMLNLVDSASKIAGLITLDSLKSLRPFALQSGSSEAGTHYDLASALIKSIRGSDIDAGLYYLARLIEGGENAAFIARRLAILSSEDIGNANPNALTLASSVLNIVEHIGYPEARIPLSQLVIYLASSPKSNSAYEAINDAQKCVQQGQIFAVPSHIKPNSNEYLYPHNFGGWCKQNYLERPLSLYKTKLIGFEKTLNEWHEKITFKAK
ncbi:MAG: replication-associated recombination protein A [Sulfurovaceae bacterium]|nr:replication-associated recombination protein A [Sulfurovaceae bacterium]